jgi:O-glycosyl hydrolase
MVYRGDGGDLSIIGMGASPRRKAWAGQSWYVGARLFDYPSPFIRLLSLVALSLLCCAAAPPPDAVTITVHRQARQKFVGFGTSLTNFDGRFEQLPKGVQESISKQVWHDLNFRILRLWFSPSVYLAHPGSPTMDAFEQRYIDSGLIRLAKEHGCTTLLLAPDDVPQSFSQPAVEAGATYREFTDAGVTAYANLLADFIARLHQETGVWINATGILNEPNDRPIRFQLRQWPMVITALRRELDQRGLKNVAIIAPEAASCDDTAYAMVDVLRHSPAAWADLNGIATHTYNMGATDVMAGKIAGTSKSYWQTESSTPGPQEIGDPLNGATTAGRVLSDLNHGVTHWLWFIGFEQADPKDNGTRLLKFDATRPGGAVEKFSQYGTIAQLSRAFPPGSVMYACTSSAEGTMTWTYGTKPAVLAAAARLRDGSWSIGVVNCSSDRYSDPAMSEFDRTQGGPPGKTIRVSIRVEAITRDPKAAFRVRISDAEHANRDAGTVRADGGVVTVDLAPLQLKTLSLAK